MPPTVSNAGPLIVLAKINALYLLKLIYGQVLFSTGVYEEAVVQGIRRGYDDAHTLHRFLQQEGWQPTTVDDIPAEITALPLDRGEKESIALALSLQGLLLMDEERGREVARLQGLQVRGTLGVLVQAYRQTIIPAEQLRVYFMEIESRQDIWINPSLCRRLLQELGLL